MIKAKDVVQVPKLRFPEFDGEGATKKLGDTSKVKHGFAFKGEYFASKGKYIVLTPGNFNPEGGFRYQGGKEKYYTNSNFPSEYILQKGEILTVMTEQAVGLIGSALIVPESGIFLHNQRLGLFQTGPEIIRIFLFHYLKTIKLRILLSNTAAGTKVRHTSPQKIESVNIFYPTLPEQQIIASFLSEVDQKIQQLTRKKELLEQYKRGVMQKIFSREIRFKDENGNDYPDWEEKRLGEVCKFLDAKRIPISEAERLHKKGHYPYYGASGIIDYVDDYIFDGEYVLLGEDGANILNRSTPLAFTVSGKIWVNNHAHVMEAYGSTQFLAESLERIRYEKYNTGTAQPKLNAKICKNIPIVLPTHSEQQKIASFLSTIDKKIESVKTQLTQTQQFKKGLLQQIFI